MISDAPSKLLPEHIKESLDKKIQPQSKATRICLFNFEASNIAADAVSSYVFSNSEIQVHTIMDRTVPAWVGDGTDIIIMSYSGNSPEIDFIYDEAKSKGARIHCITSGGRLAEVATSGKDDLHLIPKGLSNLDATGYEIGTLVNLYDAMGVEGIRDAMIKALPAIISYRDSVWDSKFAWKLSVKIGDRIPVFYCPGEIRAVHKRWKMLINQVLCRLAFSGELPEFDHNEIVSWTEDRSNIAFIVLMFKINTESELLNKIQGTVTGLLPEYRLNILTVDIEGELMERAIRGIIMADATVNCLKGGE